MQFANNITKHRQATITTRMVAAKYRFERMGNEKKALWIRWFNFVLRWGENHCARLSKMFFTQAERLCRLKAFLFRAFGFCLWNEMHLLSRVSLFTFVSKWFFLNWKSHIQSMLSAQQCWQPSLKVDLPLNSIDYFTRSNWDTIMEIFYLKKCLFKVFLSSWAQSIRKPNFMHSTFLILPTEIEMDWSEINFQAWQPSPTTTTTPSGARPVLN